MNKKKLLVSFLTLVILVLFIDPFGATIGFQDIDSYRPLRDVLDKTENSKVLYLASYDDYYSIESNSRLRNETSEGFAELGYESVLSAASFGDTAFNSYLFQQGFSTHRRSMRQVVCRSMAGGGGTLGVVQIGSF